MNSLGASAESAWVGDAARIPDPRLVPDALKDLRSGISDVKAAVMPRRRVEQLGLGHTPEVDDTARSASMLDWLLLHHRG